MSPAAILTALLLGGASPGEGSWESLCDLEDRFILFQQGWGEMGIDTCAHAPGQKPLPLQIKDERFEKGLGHHAPGEIVVDLGGEYDLFEARVGVQWQGGNVGSVVFQVFLDGEKRFESPVLREKDPAVPVRIPLQGGRELRLKVTDAGDGITCDCADWAAARLRRSSAPAARPAGQFLDVAPFARVMSWDPERKDGARASRIEEFRAEDVYPGTEVLPGADGLYKVPRSGDVRGCLGLEWIERRRLREVSAEFPAGASPPPEGIEVEAWVGESAWQGSWKRLEGPLERSGNLLRLPIDRKKSPEARRGVKKVRWIFPKGAEPVPVARLGAVSAGLWESATIRVEFESPPGGSGAPAEVYNGFLEEPAAAGPPLRLKVRCSRPRPANPDRTVLRFQLPGGSFGVAADDILASECVYVEEAGLFAVREPSSLTLAEYRRKIAGRKTVLERVRDMPDQTFAQALARTRNPIQDNGPVLLSLACDDRKFIVERAGAIQRDSFRATPRFGSGKNDGLRRTLGGGWLPVPEISVEDRGIRYSQRAFAAPLAGGPLLVSEFTVKNPVETPVQASLRLEFLADAGKGAKALLERTQRGALVLDGKKILAFVDGTGAGSLDLRIQEGALEMQGTLGGRGESAAVLYIPGWEMKPGAEAGLADPAKFLAAVREHWEEALRPAARIEIPDELLQNLIRASQVHCMIAARSEAGGERIAPWIASMSYGPLESEANSIIRAMDFLGHHDFARRSLDYFIHRYHERGYLTTGYTLLGTGWHLWTLGEHVALARDLDWLSRAAPRVSRACRWVVEQRKKTLRLDPRGEKMPENGLVPPGVIADWNAFAYYFCLNGYYCAGLRSAAEALREIGSPEAPALLRDAADFRTEILRACRWTRDRMPVLPLQDGTWVPGYPSQVHCPGPTAQFFPGEDGNRSWCYDVEVGMHQLVPLGILDAASAEATSLMDHMEDVQFLSDGWFDYPAEESRKDWFNRGGFSKVQPFYTRNAEVHALRDDAKPFLRSYFNAAASLLNTEVLSFWEHFHNAGAWNKTHETGYFLYQSRLLLLQERGDRLWLAPFAPEAWLEDGKRISVEGAPTFFGRASYEIRSSAAKGFIEASIRPPQRNPPREIVLRLRRPAGKPIRAVSVNGKPHAGFDAARGCIFLEPSAQEIVLRAEY